MIDKIILAKTIIWASFLLNGLYTHLQLKELLEKQDALVQILNAMIYDNESSKESSRPSER